MIALALLVRWKVGVLLSIRLVQETGQITAMRASLVKLDST
jgi:hypothetical protein